MQNIKLLIFSTVTLLIILASPTFSYAADAPAPEASSPAASACAGITEAFGGTCDPSDGDAAQKKVGGIFGTVVNILSYIIGGVSVIMLIIGGFRYIISGGDSNGIQGAKNTIIYALVGLAVVLFAQVIVKFVIGRLGSAAR